MFLKSAIEEIYTNKGGILISELKKLLSLIAIYILIKQIEKFVPIDIGT